MLFFLPDFQNSQVIQSNNEKSTFPIEDSEIFQLAMLDYWVQADSEDLLFQNPGELYLMLQNLRVPYRETAPFLSLITPRFFQHLWLQWSVFRQHSADIGLTGSRNHHASANPHEFPLPPPGR